MRAAPVVAVALCVVGLLATPALAVKTVSTSDGMTLTLTDTGAFSSLTVDGNTVPTLGVAGGFFIYPVDGVSIPTDRKTFNAGTAVTGTAVQSGSDVHITTSAIQNQTFDIWLRGGLPYLKIDGTVTGNGTDHVFLVDFRIPVDANGWTWGDSVIGSQTVVNGTGNWYFNPFHFWQARHPDLSINPFGSVAKTTSPTMGLSLAPLLVPPQAYAIQYNSQGGFWIQFEMGTTNKTTKHPNTAELHFVLYKHNPSWGNRSAVQRYQGFFPQWFSRSVSGGNWYIDPGAANRISSPEDFRAKFQEGTNWDDAYTDLHNILTMRYQETWAMHITYTDPMVAENQAVDVASNHNVCGPCPNRGWQRDDQSDALLLSGVMQPDGSYVGPDEPGSWRDVDAWRWMMNPDPEIPNFREFNPGRNRAQLSQYQEWYYQWSTGPTDPASQHFSGMYHDSTGSWVGWGAVWNFNPNHWATYDYNPVPYWGRHGTGMLSMWHLFSCVEFMKYTYEHMRRTNRPVMANSGANYELPWIVPYLDYVGAGEGFDAGSSMQPMAIVRTLSGTKPAGYLLNASGGIADEAMIKGCMTFGVWPGAASLSTSNEGSRALYQQYMPRFDELDAAGWNPITAATASNTSMYLERFGPDANGNVFLVLRAPTAGSTTVTVSSADLGWSTNPNVTVTAKYGAAPSTSYDGNGNLVLNFGSIAAADDRMVQLHYNGTSTMVAASFSASATTVAVNTAVNFTDTSAGSPTSWLWDFGDGSISTSQNPSHTYTSGGKYNVALTAVKSAGQDTEVRDRYITVTQVPAADFWGKSQRGPAPLTVIFQDETLNFPTSWSWNFGDGNTSTAQNPTHVYTAAGTYTVALTAYNGSGNNTKTRTSYIVATNPSIPVANFTWSARMGAPPFAVSFTDTSTNTPTSWSWTFGDGGTSNAQSPSHTYTTTGIYTVALTVTNAAGNNTRTVANLIGCCNEVIEYVDTISVTNGTIISGGLNEIKNEDGTYQNVQCGPSQAYHARYDTTVGYTPSQIYGVRYEFKGRSTQAATPNATLWIRSVNDGPSQLVSRNPLGSTDTWITGEVNWLTGIMQTGNLLVFELCGCPQGTTNYNIYTDVARLRLFLMPGGGSAPVANFTGNPTSGAAPLAVSFTDTSTNTPTAWSWTFGDGGTSTAQNPSHTYNSTGSFTVALTATNAYGQNTNTKNNYIGVGNPPVANFSGTPTSGTAPLNVSFTDSSTNSPTSWSWTFGDGGTSTAQNPSHTYAAGTFTVSLTATNAYGSDGETKTDYISASGGGSAPVANFTGTPLTGVAPLAVQFTDTSTNTPTAWSWTFGDGNTSTVQSPAHTYNAAGDYTVSLTATNPYGLDGETKASYISVSSSGGDIVYYTQMYELGGGTTIVSGSIDDTHAADGVYLRMACDPTSHIFHLRDDFRPNETASQIAKLKLEYRLHVTRTDTPGFWLSICKLPTSGSEYMWGPGLFSTTDQTVTWETTSPGDYMDTTERWIITDICGCPSGNENNYEVYLDLAKATITLKAAPVAEFAGTPTSGTAPLAVSFTDQSTNTPTAWSWTFGDGNTSTTQNPSHTYAAGTYTVSLTATNAYGSDGETKTNYITAGNPPVANFSGTPTSGAAPLSVAFTDSSTNSPTSWSWTFGDGGTSTAQNPSHSYAAGTFTVSLTATNPYGSDGETKTNCITAGNAPVANFSGTPTSGPVPLAVAFTDSSTNSPTSWSWTFGDGGSSTAQNPSHTYTSAGSFTVALTATNAYGSDGETKTDYISATSGGSTPTFVAAGAVASGTGAITPALPAGIASNDILLLFVETAAQTISISNQNGGTWAQVSGSPQSTGSGGASSATRLTAFWSRYNGTQGAPTTTDSGNHQLGRIIAVRGAATSGNPWDVTAGGVESTADTSGSIPGATTTVANALVVAAIATALPDASGTANFSAWSNANLSGLAERTDNTVTAGNGGGLAIATGAKATAGAYGNTAVTCAASARKAMLSIALKPAGGGEQVAAYPTSWGYANGKWVTLISGGLADLQALDGNYMVIQCDTTPGTYWYSCRYTTPTGYTPSQVSQITIDYVAKSDSGSTPSAGSWCSILQSDGSTWANIGQDWYPGTSDTSFNWSTTSPSTYMQADGSVVYQFCGCPNGTYAYSISSNLMRVTLTLN